MKTYEKKKLWGTVVAAAALSCAGACAQSTQQVSGATPGAMAPAVAVAPAAQLAVAQPAAPVAAAPLRPVRRDGMLTPLVVKMIEQKRSENSAVVVARVERRSGIDAAVQLSIELPAGATLVRGDAKAELPPSTDSSTVDKEFELSFTAVPAANFKVVAEYRTAVAGARAVGTYRFGRPEPVVAPAPKGTDTKVGGWNLGPSVKMQ